MKSKASKTKSYSEPCDLRSKRGFTLIETLVAITVLLLAIGGPMSLAAQSYFTARFSKDRLIATYLAQEGLEMFRFKRDSNSLTGNDWLSGLNNCLGTNKCIFVGTNGTVANRCSGQCPVLRRSVASGVHVYASSNPATKYTREINAQELTETEIVVTSTVKWNNGNIQRQVELKETLHDWQ